MMRLFKLSALFCGLFALTTLVGCGQGPESAVEEAVGVDEGDGTNVTTETQDQKIVTETTEVTDPDTGATVVTDQEKTPVTIEKETTTETDVNVDEGDTKETVK